MTQSFLNALLMQFNIARFMINGSQDIVYMIMSYLVNISYKDCKYWIHYLNKDYVSFLRSIMFHRYPQLYLTNAYSNINMYEPKDLNLNNLKMVINNFKGRKLLVKSLMNEVSTSNIDLEVEQPHYNLSQDIEFALSNDYDNVPIDSNRSNKLNKSKSRSKFIKLKSYKTIDASKLKSKELKFFNKLKNRTLKSDKRKKNVQINRCRFDKQIDNELDYCKNKYYDYDNEDDHIYDYYDDEYYYDDWIY